MNPILLSFLCGAAFIGGACVTTALVVIANQFKSKKDRDELMNYWRQSIEKQAEQNKVLERIVASIEKKGPQ